MRWVALALAVAAAVTAAPALASSGGAAAYPRPVALTVSRGGVAPVDVLGHRAAQPDSGRPGDVRSARTAVVVLLDRDGDADTPDLIAHPATRALALEQVWDATVVARRAARTPAVVHDGARFVVSRWEGVQVAGDRATATLTGRWSYRDGSRSAEGDVHQLWVELARTGSFDPAAGGWRLLLVRRTVGVGGCCLPEPVVEGPVPAAAAG